MKVENCPRIVNNTLLFCDAVSKVNNIQQLPYEMILHIASFIKIKCHKCDDIYDCDEIYNLNDNKKNRLINQRVNKKKHICIYCVENLFFDCCKCEIWTPQYYKIHNPLFYKPICQGCNTKGSYFSDSDTDDNEILNDSDGY